MVSAARLFPRFAFLFAKEEIQKRERLLAVYKIRAYRKHAKSVIAFGKTKCSCLLKKILN